jgi:hypothetical protein
MDRLTVLIMNRLVLAGLSAFAAPYIARDTIALANEIGVVEEGDIVRLAIIVKELGAIEQVSLADLGLILAVLRRCDIAPASRLSFIEQTWLSRTPNIQGA